MNTRAGDHARSAACTRCLRRGWLLGELSPLLDYTSADVTRLLGLLGLDDRELLRAIAGRRRAELSAQYEHFEPGWLSARLGVERVCRHDRCYPAALHGGDAPSALHVAGSLRRLTARMDAPVVAILGTERPTDYGLAIAKGLARGLAVAGVTVATGSVQGIAAAAQRGVTEIDGPAIVVAGDGLDVAAGGRRRALYERLAQTGCVVAELPCGISGRRWGPLAAERVLTRLAALTIVVEADDSPRALAGAQMARALGRTVAAVPGRVTSRASAGTHALLLEGAYLVRGAADALDLLHGVKPLAECPDLDPPLDDSLQATLELVSAGRDTPAQLIAAGDGEPEATLSALSELELLGLLVRGQGGRYVPCDPPPARPVR